ncbi:MAG: RNA polymerase sigma factor [bacterium]
MKSDLALVHDLLANDGAAFEALYENYKHPLFAYCERILGNSADAEDVVHDTFLKVQQELASLRDPALFKRWLFRIARNEALMKIRKRRMNGQVDTDSVWDDTTPHHQLEAKETVAIVQQLLMNLKPDYREALVLREYENLSYAEIAEIVSATEGAVKMRIFKARSALTEKLKQYYQ